MLAARERFLQLKLDCGWKSPSIQRDLHEVRRRLRG
jgi:hypothetical protein